MNYKSLTYPVLAGKRAQDPETKDASIPFEGLPQCEEDRYSQLLHPHVMWLGEVLDPDIVTEVEKEHDICLVVGTFSVVYLAAMFTPQVLTRGMAVAEFNMETISATDRSRSHFPDPHGATLPPELTRKEIKIISRTS